MVLFRWFQEGRSKLVLSSLCKGRGIFRVFDLLRNLLLDITRLIDVVNFNLDCKYNLDCKFSTCKIVFYLSITEVYIYLCY